MDFIPCGWTRLFFSVHEFTRIATNKNEEGNACIAYRKAYKFIACGELLFALGDQPKGRFVEIGED
jgi:hypothetical protein